MNDHVIHQGEHSTTANMAGGMPAPVQIPSVAAADADEVMAIGRVAAAAAEALCNAAAAAQRLGLPEPDSLGVAGLDYSALGEISLSLLVWAGALAQAAQTAASGLVVVERSRPHLP